MLITEAFASQDALRAWLPEFTRQFPRGGVFGLSGELGAGKTTLVRELISYLAQQLNATVPRVISPTYVFHQNHRLGKLWIEHFDLYRLTDADESSLIEIGYYEAIERMNRDGGFVFVEWPEQAADRRLLQLEYLISLEVVSAEARRLTVRKL